MPADTRFWHPFADMHAVRGHEFVLERGDGAYVWDNEGNRYLDGTASLWCVNVGHGRTEIVEAAAAQMRELASYSCFGAFANRPALELTERLAGLAPLDDPRIFLVSGGGDAIDTAAKLARRYFAEVGQPDRVHLISRTQGCTAPTVWARRSAASRPTARAWARSIPMPRRFSTTRCRRSRTRSRAWAPTVSPPSSWSR
jgi:adenosylmethionine-8-amino-7-oxononanoate aminotransferase